LKIDPLKLSRSKTAIPLKASTTAPNYGSTFAPAKKTPRPAPSGATITDEQRRRTQRVLLRVRASVHVALQGKMTIHEVATLSVNPHGAIVVMKDNLPADTRLVLEHGSTRQQVACKVARPPKQMPEGFHVPLEFDTPAPGFWHIEFPPADWRPENV
jgi:hypothetical protein